MTTQILTCFKAYDIRGKLGDKLNGDIAYRSGSAYAQHLGAERLADGEVVRLSRMSTSTPLPVKCRAAPSFAQPNAAQPSK